MQQIQYPFKNEHDVLIALIEDFNNSVAEINDQMLRNSTDFLEIKKILETHNKQVDDRLTKQEEKWKDLDPKALAKVDENFIKTVNSNADWIKQFNDTKHIIWLIVTGAFLIIGYLAHSVKLPFLH